MPKKTEENLFKSFLEKQNSDQEGRDRNYAEKIAKTLYPHLTGDINKIFGDLEDPYPLRTFADSFGHCGLAYLRCSRKWSIDGLASFLKNPRGNAWKAMRKARLEDGDNALIAFPITGLGDVFMGTIPTDLHERGTPWFMVLNTPKNIVQVSPVKGKDD